MRLINADDLKEQLRKRHNEREIYLDSGVLYEIDDSPTVNNARALKIWIPVKAALPNLYAKCIVQDKSDNIGIGVYTEFGWTFSHYMDDPVAWMPAPELYREDG